MTYDRWRRWRAEQAKLNRAVNRIFLILLGLVLGALVAIKCSAQQVAGTGKTGPNGSMIGYNAAGPNWLYVPVDANGYILVDCPSCSSGGITSINGDTTPAQQFKATGGGLSVSTAGGITTYNLVGGGLTGGVNTGKGNQVGCYPTNAAPGTTIGPCANIYALDPSMSTAQVNALFSSLSGSNSVVIPAGTPQALYATNGQVPYDLRLGASWFQMPGVACDGKQASGNITITSGSNTSTTAVISAADIGKTFFFSFKSGFGYGLTQSVWTATLAGYSSGTATWSANAPFTATEQPYYGNDNLATVQMAMEQASYVFPLTIPTGCGLLLNGTLAWDHGQTIASRQQNAGGFIGRPGADVIATTDTSGQNVAGAGTGLKGFYVANSTDIDWSLGYNLRAANGALTVVPPVYRPLYDHTTLVADPLAPGWITGGKNGVASITQNSAVICIPNAMAPPAVGQQIMFPYFSSIFTSSVSSTAGSCSGGFTARTMAAAFPNTSAYTSAQAEWFTGSAIQSTTTTIPTTITYPLTLTVTLSTNPVPGWISNVPQTGHIKLCGIEADYGGITANTITLRKGPATSAGCTGTTPTAPMNPCAAKNLFGSSADQPWPVIPSINAGDSTPSGANWFPGQCGGNFAIAFPTANGNTFVGGGLSGGYLSDLQFVGASSLGTTGNANNAGSVLVQGNNAFFGSHVENLIGTNLQYGFMQGPASSGQHGVAAVGPTGFGNTFHNLWFFAAFPLAFVDMQGSNVTGMNLNSTEMSPFDGTAVGSSTCLQVGYTLDEQTGGTVTSTSFDNFDTYGCEPENGSHAWQKAAVDIQGSHISFGTANFEGIPNVYGGDHLKLTNSTISLPAIDYGSDNDFGVVDGSNAGYITNIWDGRPQFFEWGRNAKCSAFAGGIGPAVACGAGTVQGYEGRGIDPSIYGTKAHFILGGMITPWMWNNNPSFDTNPFTATGASDPTATYWGASSQCALGGGAACHSAHFNGFNGFLFVGPFNQLYDGPYSLDATFKSAGAPSSFTLTIKANDSGTGQCASGSTATVYSGTVTTATTFGPGPQVDFDMTGHAGCVLDVTYSAGSTTDTIFTDRFNLVPRPGYVRGPVAAPAYPGSCPAGTPPSSWLGSFSGFAYFCDGGTVKRVAIT